MAHRYSDNCTCSKCENTFRDAVMKAIERGEKIAAKKSPVKKGKKK